MSGSAPLVPIDSLYIHVPFCAHKCEYCAFYSHLPSAHAVDRYVDALNLELVMRAGQLRPRTRFFGGGTPSLLSLTQWRRILEKLAELGMLEPTEWTVECNPATISLEK